jgi:hypothetical protein
MKFLRDVSQKGEEYRKENATWPEKTLTALNERRLNLNSPLSWSWIFIYQLDVQLPTFLKFNCLPSKRCIAHGSWVQLPTELKFNHSLTNNWSWIGHQAEVWLFIDLKFNCPPFWSSIAYQVNDVLTTKLDINCPPSWNWIT